MFLVRVRVEGGVTGARESTLKMHGGKPALFKTAREAEQQAAEYMRRLTNPCGSAQYTAWAEELAHNTDDPTQEIRGVQHTRGESEMSEQSKSPKYDALVERLDGQDDAESACNSALAAYKELEAEHIIRGEAAQEPDAIRNFAAAMFDAGFRAGADWSGEEHILHDMGSFRYNEERNAAIDDALRGKEGK